MTQKLLYNKDTEIRALRTKLVSEENKVSETEIQFQAEVNKFEREMCRLQTQLEKEREANLTKFKQECSYCEELQFKLNEKSEHLKQLSVENQAYKKNNKFLEDENNSVYKKYNEILLQVCDHGFYLKNLNLPILWLFHTSFYFFYVEDVISVCILHEFDERLA